MAATSICVPGVGERESQLPLASLGGSPRSVSGSDPGFFQINASALELRMCEILCAPLKSEFCFLKPSGSPVRKPHWPFPASCSGGFSSWCRTSGLGCPMWGLDPLLLGENLCNCDCPFVCGSPIHECRSGPITHL